MGERVCPVDGRRFVPKNGSHVYCSTVCRERARAAMRAPGKAARYGSAHQRLRREAGRAVATGSVACCRCGLTIEPGEPWDLDHADGSNGYLGASHADCNRAAGAAKAQRPAPGVDDPDRGVFWGPPNDEGGPRRWSRPWWDWRLEESGR